MAHIETRLARIERKLDDISFALNIDIEMEKHQMADFTTLVAEVEKTRGLAASTNAFVAGLKKQIDDMAGQMNDVEDQQKIAALAADLDAIATSLPQAIVANNEPPTPPAEGGSTGGIVG